MQIEYGLIRVIKPTKKVYGVEREETGAELVFCRPVYTGGHQAGYRRNDKVLILKTGSVDWVILGKVDPVPPPSAPFQNLDADENFAVEREKYTKNPQVDNEPDYRPVDRRDQKEPTIFSGDAVIHNGSKYFINRSFLKIFKFGDVFVKASDYCFQYFNKKDSKILTRAANLLRETFGFKEHVTTVVPSTLSLVTPGATIYKQEIRAYPIIPLFKDKETTIGVIPPIVTNPAQSLTSKPIASQGERVVYGFHQAHEVDNLTNTYRFEKSILPLGKYEFQAGTFVMENTGVFTTPVMGPTDPITPNLVTAPVTAGCRARYTAVDGVRGFDIVYDATLNNLSISGFAGAGAVLNTFVIGDVGMKMQRGPQYLALSDAGLIGNVNSYTLNVIGATTVVGGVSTETAGGSIVKTAPLITLN